jgi:IPT/TIG domain
MPGRGVRVVLASFAAAVVCATALAASNVVQYTFDAAGNITGISRQSTGGFAITSFTPTSGPVGTAVTIYGMGFSTTPANNTVKFNGTTATVTASDSGSIATTVPVGATTGTITVTVGGNTVSSPQAFVVTIAGAPTVTSFTPAIGPAATSVSVTGTNFVATSGATTFALNGVNGTGDASSTTAGTFAIPANASSGRISATTSVGTGTSTSDFIVPPAGLVATDLETTTRISAGGGNVQVTVGTPNRSALVLFDGAVNGWYSLQFNALDLSPTSGSVAYKVIKPDNSVLVSGTLSMTAITSLHLPKLPATGTYSLLLSPGTATLNTLVRLESNPALTIDGAAIATTQDYPLQSSRLLFDATAGQRLGIGLKNVAFTPSGSGARVFVYKPDGTSYPGYTTCLGPQTGNTAGNCFVDIVASATGTYSIIIDSTSSPSYYTSTSVQVSTPATGTLAADVTQTVSLTRVGQQATYTFAIASGDSFAVDMSNLALAPQSGSATAYILKPDGSQLTYCSATQPGGVYCELGANQAAGTYTVYVEPAFGAYGTFNLTLKKGPLMATTDSPWSFTPAGTSEIARARFTATAGQTLNIGLGSLTYVSGSGGSSTLYVYRADASIVDSLSCTPTIAGGNCRLTLTNLAAGTYAVVVRPVPGVKISGTLTVSSDLASALTLGTTQSVSVTRVGQRAGYTFSGTAGDYIGVSAFALSTSPATEYIEVHIMKPDGTQVTYGRDWRAYNFNVMSLPVTGTYTALVYSDGPTFSMNLLVDNGSAMTIDGAAASLSADVAGRPLRYRFTGASGQRIDMGIFGLSYASGSSTTSMKLYAPDGTLLSDTSCSPSTTGSCDYSNASLGATGTYVVSMTPPSSSQINGGSFAVSTPLAGTFVIGDPARSISISRAGQTARYTFSGTSAQTLRFNWTSASVAGTGSVAVTVLNPSGGTVSSSSFANGATGGFDIASLPSTGTYTIVLDPPSGTTMSGSFSLVTR